MLDRDIEKRVFHLVRQILPPESQSKAVTLATKLGDDPAVDSLAMATLGFSVAEEFGMESEEIFSAMPSFSTVQEITTFVRQKLGN